MNPITPSQLRRIFALSNERKMDNDMLHDYVFHVTKKKSLKMLSTIEAIKIIKALQGEEYTTPDRASDSQFRKIYALMREVGWVNDDGYPDKPRLIGFIREYQKIERLEWLTAKAASDVIEAFKNMKKRMEETA